jgi:hypothetical protein
VLVRPCHFPSSFPGRRRLSLHLVFCHRFYLCFLLAYCSPYCYYNYICSCPFLLFLLSLTVLIVTARVFIFSTSPFMCPRYSPFPCTSLSVPLFSHRPSCHSIILVAVFAASSLPRSVPFLFYFVVRSLLFVAFVFSCSCPSLYFHSLNACPPCPCQYLSLSRAIAYRRLPAEHHRSGTEEEQSRRVRNAITVIEAVLSFSLLFIIGHCIFC